MPVIESNENQMNASQSENTKIETSKNSNKLTQQHLKTFLHETPLFLKQRFVIDDLAYKLNVSSIFSSFINSLLNKNLNNLVNSLYIDYAKD